MPLSLLEEMWRRCVELSIEIAETENFLNWYRAIVIKDNTNLSNTASVEELSNESKESNEADEEKAVGIETNSAQTKTIRRETLYL